MVTSGVTAVTSVVAQESVIAVFPGAGSFGGELKPLLAAVRPASLVGYPGRFGRGFGRPARTFTALVEACVAQVRSPSADHIVLVGHSFGAYVAYAVACALEESGTEVGALVVVGADGPSRLRVDEAASRDPAATADYLRGIDPSLLPDESDEWHEIVLDTTMQDLRLLREFTTAPPRQTQCPILAARGTDDPLTSTAGIGAWTGATKGASTQRVFPGGHSELLTAPDFGAWLRGVRATGR